MRELKCDLVVGPITIVVKEDETIHTVPLSGKTEDAEVKLSVKVRDRLVLIDAGIDEPGKRKSVVLSETNTQITDFE